MRNRLKVDNWFQIIWLMLAQVGAIARVVIHFKIFLSKFLLEIVIDDSIEFDNDPIRLFSIWIGVTISWNQWNLMAINDRRSIFCA